MFEVGAQGFSSRSEHVMVLDVTARVEDDPGPTQVIEPVGNKIVCDVNEDLANDVAEKAFFENDAISRIGED